MQSLVICNNIKLINKKHMYIYLKKIEIQNIFVFVCLFVLSLFKRMMKTKKRK
jgi:hypothetical protein